MGIDDSKQYMLMSSGLEEMIEFDERKPASSGSWRATIKTLENHFTCQIVSIEIDDPGGYITCLQTDGYAENFMKLLLDSQDFDVTIAGSSFNSKVVKLESGRAYLRLSR